MKILLRYSLLFLSILFVTSLIGQKAHYFKKWKSKEKFDSKEVIFLIDTTGTYDDFTSLTAVASKIDENLKEFGIITKAVLYPTDSSFNNNILCLKLEALEKAYVQLNFANKDGVPLCFRFLLKQVQPESKKPIETTIAYSIQNKEQGVNELGVELANRLMRHF